MHELGSIDQAVQMALARAEQDGGARVHRSTLHIGRLAGVEIDALRFAFKVVTQDTAAASAESHIEAVPVRYWCGSCSSAFQPSDFVFRCPGCQRSSEDVGQGREFDAHRDGDFLA